MKEELFYTPEISEFNIGFEYEYTMDDYSRYLDRTAKDEWCKESFYAGGNDVDGLEIDDISNLLDKGQVRVKYLDKYDMIELGFTQDTEYRCQFTGQEGNRYFKNVESTGFNNGISFKIILNGGSYITFSYEYYSSYQNPSGTIQMNVRNKIELNKLLNQFK